METSKSKEMEYLAKEVSDKIKNHTEAIAAEPLSTTVKRANNRRPVKSKSPKATEW